MLSGVLAALFFIPGGNVSAFYSEGGGNLNLVGDSGDNEVLVTSYETDWVWLLPLGKTTINGRQGWQYWYLERGDVTGDVFVSLGDGDDVLEFGRRMPRALSIDMGSGFDVARGEELQLQALRVSGAEALEVSGASVEKTLITGVSFAHLHDFRLAELVIECGPGNDQVWLSDMRRVGLSSAVTVRTGEGNDLVRLSGPFTGFLRLFGPILFDGGRGIDVYEGPLGRLTEFERFGPSPWLARR